MGTGSAVRRQASRRPREPLIAGGVLAALAAVTVGLNIYWDHQRDLYARFTSVYSACPTGTAWDVRTAPAEIRLEGPPRLRVYGNSGRDGSLVFSARTRIGSDRLHVADDATAQVLRDHQCPVA